MGATEAKSSTGIRRKLWCKDPGDTLLETGAPTGQRDLMSPQVCCLPGGPDQGCCAGARLAENESCLVVCWTCYS